MNEIELINQELEALEKQIQLKRQEAVKAKLKSIRKNGIEKISILTEEEENLLKTYLEKYGNPNSALIQHEWNQPYWSEDLWEKEDFDRSYIRLGNQLFNIEFNKFIDPNELEEDYIYGNPNKGDYAGRISVLGSKDRITEELDLDKLFDTVYLNRYRYDIYSHSIVDYEYNDYNQNEDFYYQKYVDEDEYDWDEGIKYMPDLQETIWHILRNQIPDKNANYMYEENNNFCPIGKYKDMPGEEEIAKILNSIDREYLTEYFKQHSEDRDIFEGMRERYPDIEPLNEEIQETKDSRKLSEESFLRDGIEKEVSEDDEFLNNVVGYATRKVEVREKNEQAAKLLQDYEQQLPKKQKSFEDE